MPGPRGRDGRDGLIGLKGDKGEAGLISPPGPPGKNRQNGSFRLMSRHKQCSNEQKLRTSHCLCDFGTIEVLIFRY